jgi:polyhydroxyalkanoate synthesis regulator phasin
MAMAHGDEKAADPGQLTRLAEKGQETVGRIADEAMKQPVVSDAVGRANEAREWAEGVVRRVLGELGMAQATEVDKLKREVGRLERRVKKLEAEKREAAP